MVRLAGKIGCQELRLPSESPKDMRPARRIGTPLTDPREPRRAVSGQKPPILEGSMSTQIVADSDSLILVATPAALRKQAAQLLRQARQLERQALEAEYLRLQARGDAWLEANPDRDWQDNPHFAHMCRIEQEIGI